MYKITLGIHEGILLPPDILLDRLCHQVLPNTEKSRASTNTNIQKKDKNQKIEIQKMEITKSKKNSKIQKNKIKK